MRRYQDLALHVRSRRIEAGRRILRLDALGEPELRGERARHAHRDQHPAVLDELLEFSGAGQAHAAANVIGLGVETHALELVVLLVGQRLRELRLLVDDRLAVVGLVRHDDHVVLRVQVRAALHVILVNQIERNPETIEGEADPADLLGVRPGRVDRDARKIDIDRLDALRHLLHGLALQPQRLDLLARPVGRGNQQRACRELAAADLERRLRRLDGRVLEPVPQRHQVE